MLCINVFHGDSSHSALERQNANLECNAVNAVQITHVLLQKLVRVEELGGHQGNLIPSCGSYGHAAAHGTNSVQLKVYQFIQRRT